MQPWLIVLGSAVAGALLWLGPGSFDAEHWSLYAPLLRHAAAWLVGGYAALLGLVTWRLRPTSHWTALLGPVILAAPAVLLKPLVTDLRGLVAGEGMARLLHLPVALLLVAPAAAAVGTMARRRAAAAGLWVAVIGLVIWTALRYGELEQQEAVVASGRVESLLSELALAVGTAAALHGRPPADGAQWLPDRLRCPGWYVADDGDWYWAPRRGIGPGVVRLHYVPPGDEADLAAVVLRSVAVVQVSRGARPFEAEIALDGAFSCYWPKGPPPALKAAREAAP